MIYIRNIMIAAITLMIATAATGDTPTPLAREAHINHSLMSAQAADKIRKTCPSISARMWVALVKANALKSYARRKGYSEPEVRAFLKDPTEKARVKALAADYLKARGVIAGDVETYCTVGRAEITKRSLVGQMLRAR